MSRIFVWNEKDQTGRKVQRKAAVRPGLNLNDDDDEDEDEDEEEDDVLEPPKMQFEGPPTYVINRQGDEDDDVLEPPKMLFPDTRITENDKRKRRQRAAVVEDDDELDDDDGPPLQMPVMQF